MPFLPNKVALVTGGASGIGLAICEQFMNVGLKGLCIVDCNETFGNAALKQFGNLPVIFRKTDVQDRNSLEDAFKKTVETFGSIDVVVNNAGIFDEKNWQRSIDVNFVGVANGTILAFENYLVKHRSSSEGVIVNVSSIAGIFPSPSIPIYSATKSAVIGLGRAMGDEQLYARRHVRVITLCPGATETAMMQLDASKCLDKDYATMYVETIAKENRQKASAVGDAVAYVIEHGKTGSVWVSSNGKRPYQVHFPSSDDISKQEQATSETDLIDCFSFRS